MFNKTLFLYFKNLPNFEVAITEMYPRIPCEPIADPFASAEHLVTTALDFKKSVAFQRKKYFILDYLYMLFHGKAIKSIAMNYYRLISSQLLSIIISMRYSISSVSLLPLFIASNAH